MSHFLALIPRDVIIPAGLGIAALAALAIVFRLPVRTYAMPSICRHCGTAQPSFSRPIAAARQLLGPDK